MNIVLRSLLKELRTRETLPQWTAACAGTHSGAEARPAAAATASQSGAAAEASGRDAVETSQPDVRPAAGVSPLQHAGSGAAAPSPAGTAAASASPRAVGTASDAPHGQLEEHASRPSHSRPASRVGQRQRQRQLLTSAHAASSVAWPVGRQRPSLTSATTIDSVVAAAAQLVLWALCSRGAGVLRDCLWVAAGVALPPALAVWGRPVLWALLLAGLALLLAAWRRWRLLGLLLAGAAALDAAAWLHSRLQRWLPRQPADAGWPDSL